MAQIFQQAPFDSQQHGLTGLRFPITLTHNSQATVPLGLPGFKKPYAVLIGEDAAQGFQEIIGFAWDLDGSNRPRVTVQLASGAGTIECELYVLYKV